MTFMVLLAERNLLLKNARHALDELRTPDHEAAAHATQWLTEAIDGLEIIPLHKVRALLSAGKSQP